MPSRERSVWFLFFLGVECAIYVEWLLGGYLIFYRVRACTD